LDYGRRRDNAVHATHGLACPLRHRFYSTRHGRGRREVALEAVDRDSLACNRIDPLCYDLAFERLGGL
jgi:hypothetical protein